MSHWLDREKGWATGIKRDVLALWFAAKDVRTPVAAKLVSAVVAAYALSPIDLIPDFIPVLGYLDDLVILPVGIMLAVRLIPPVLMSEFRRVATLRTDRPISRTGLCVIVAIWLAIASVLIWLFLWRGTNGST